MQLAADAGEMPAPMPGAECGEEMQANPAPAALATVAGDSSHATMIKN
jgi:hypothetical protein